MRFFYLILFLLLSVACFGQPTFPTYKTQKKPKSVIRNKFYQPKVIHSHTHGVDSDNKVCFSTEVNEALRKKYNLPSIEEFEVRFMGMQRAFMKERARKRTTATVITIPVIVHVVHNGEAVGVGTNISEAQVRSQIDVINEDFRRKPNTPGFNDNPVGADVEIEFALALRDEFGNTLDEPGIHRVNGGAEFWEVNEINSILKPQTIWDPELYLNMWVVNFGGENSNLLGFAQFPNLSGLDGLNDNMGIAATDGVVMGYQFFGREGNVLSPFDGGRTTTHEIGHWLGLRHIWGDAPAGENGCRFDDFCDDTPNTRSENRGCPLGNNSCGNFLFDDGDDMVENYMDYTSDECMNIFTQDQKTRMLTVMQNSPRRKELLNSTVHLALERPIAFVSSNRQQICAGDNIQFSDNSVNTPSSRQWIFTDAQDNQVGFFETKDPVIQFNGPGSYSLTFIASNNEGADTLFLQDYISVLSSEQLPFPFQESFEEANLLDNWQIYNPDNDRTWQLANVNSSDVGSRSLIFDNFSNVDGDPSGTQDLLLSPSIDLSTNSFAFLNFDVAYAPFGGEFADTLAIYASTDCGENFELIWFRGGDDLATSTATQESFVPIGPSEWQEVSISLQDFNGAPSVHLAIVNFSGWGNNLFIDDIEIFQPNFADGSSSNFSTLEDTISVGSSITYYDASEQFPLAWLWQFEGGDPVTSEQQNVTVTYNSVGTFNVQLATANFANQNNPDVLFIPDYITVVGKPQVAISSSTGSTNVCLGDSLILRATGATFYEWYNDRGTLASEADSIKIFPQENTSYSVIGFDRFGGESTADIALTVNEIPQFNLGEDITTSVQNSLPFDVGQDFADYLWNDGSSTRSVTINGSDYGAGTFPIYATATNASGCSFTDTVNVTFIAAPVAEVESSTGSLSVCLGDAITLTASGGIEFEWKDNNGVVVSNENSIEVLLSSNTTFTITVFDDFGGETSEELSVTVNPLPNVDLGDDVNLASDQTTTLDVGATFDSYLWSDGSTEKTLEIIGSEFGEGTFEISVTVTDENNCVASDTIVLTVSEPLSLFETKLSDVGVKVYPIPSENEVIVELDKRKQGLAMKVFDVNGKLLKTLEIKNLKNKVDISSFSKGLYFFHLSKGIETQTIKVVKE